jgi:hypothetical protein
MKTDRVLGWGGFASAAIPLLAGPWLFGAWETWHFWPLCGLLFASLVGWGLRLLLFPAQASTDARPNETPAKIAWAAVVLALAYVAVRSVLTPVRLDAERTFLLFLMPVIVAAQVAFCMTVAQRRVLWGLLLYNFFLLAVYGLTNHIVTGSRLVLWRPGYEQYWIEARATGSYFCPNHFAGIMEIALATGIGLLLARGHGWVWRMAGALLSVLAVAGVVLSKSRGGGVTVLVMCAVALALGFVQWSALKRWCWRVALVSLGVIALVAFLQTDSGYMKRFRSYFWQTGVERLTLRERVERIRSRIEPADRWQMISAALRGWRMAPVFGIGAGMHRHYWPHTAASSDGDRESNDWPTYLNNTYYSYEAHSDWAQLLEEYGVVGFGLAVVTCGLILTALTRRAYAAARRWRHHGRRGLGIPSWAPDPFALSLAAVLALSAMAFHSLGDFNLQMPATGWVLAAVVALSAGFGESTERNLTKEEARDE